MNIIRRILGLRKRNKVEEMIKKQYGKSIMNQLDNYYEQLEI